VCAGAEECGHGAGAGQPAREEGGDPHHQALTRGTEGLRQGIFYTVLTHPDLHHSVGRVCVKSEESNPDPGRSEKLDPDLHQREAYPQY
jgi:hypothetical protein